MFKVNADINLRLKQVNQDSVESTTDPGGLLGKKRFADQNESSRKQAIEEWYEIGGQVFVDWISEHYRTHSGEPLRWDKPFFLELALIVGNPWLEEVWIEKSAQVGWSELAIATIAFWLAKVRIPCAYGVEQASKLGDIIGPRVQTAFNFCAPIQALKKEYHDAVGRKDIDTKQRQITVGGTVATFFYTGKFAKGKKRSSNESNERQASSAMSSFVAHAMIADEIELWSPQSIDIAKKRMESVTSPTKIFRAGSTPGHVGGVVDRAVEASKYLFQWHIICPHCQGEQFIHPYGNLIKPTIVENDGASGIIYLDSVGKPINWFCHDSSSLKTRLDTAYIGCQHCEGELDFSILATGCFKCRNTGITSLELNQLVVQNRQPVYDGVGVRLPKLCVPGFNPPLRMRSLWQSRNVADELQQGLGIAAAIGGGHIDIERLLECRHLKHPIDIENYERFFVLGVDQGRVGQVIVVQEWWMPITGVDPMERWSKAFVETVDCMELPEGFEGIARIAAKYSAQIVGIDSEPEISKAGDFARDHPPRFDDKDFSVFLFDQVNLSSGQTIRRIEQSLQGVKVPIYRLDRTAGLDAVRARIYDRLHRFPPQWEYNSKDSNSLFYQYLTSERTLQGSWTCADTEPDHYFHADNFAQMAVLAYYLEPRPPKLGCISVPKYGSTYTQERVDISDFL